MNKKFRFKHERDTDIMVIYRGMGWQQFESASFFNRYFNDGKLEMDFEKGLDDNGFYLDPHEAVLIMKELEAYQPTVKEFMQEFEKVDSIGH
jgi:hypothetical protein